MDSATQIDQAQATAPHAGEKFDQWAIVDIMGHQRMAGRVSEQALGGTSFVRVDVPETEHQQAFTRLLGSSAIYSITPCTEEIARMMARQFRARPIQQYELPAEFRTAISQPALTHDDVEYEFEVVDDDDDLDSIGDLTDEEDIPI